METKKIFLSLFTVSAFRLLGVSGVDTEVSVKEGDSVTLNTGVEMNQQENIKWYFNNTLIAHINRSLSVICTDVQCNKSNERFRDRLELDNQTGSLTITNIRNTDSGEYTLMIIKGSDSERIFKVSVHDSGPASLAVTGICVAVLVLMIFSVMAAVNYYRRRSSRRALVWVLKALYIQKQEPPQSQASADSPGQDGEY